MPSEKFHPQTPSSASTGARTSRLVQLLVGGGVALIVFFLGLLTWRPGQLPPAHKPAVEPPKTVQIAPPSPQPEAVDVVSLNPDAEVVGNAGAAASPAEVKAPADDPPRSPEPLTVDQIVEKRLQASEDDLRRQLQAIPELRLLSDDEVRKRRAKERIALIDAIIDARRRNRPVMPLIVVPPGVRGRAAAALVAQEERNYQALAEEQQRAPALAAQQVVYQFNVRLQQTLRRAALEAGLALHSGPQQLPSYVAAEMAEITNDLRQMGFGSVRGASSSSAERTKAVQSWCARKRPEQKSGAVAALVQTWQIEDEATRLLLVRELAHVRSVSATTALADRALLDLSPAVRRAAIAALAERPAYQYVPILLHGLRYPWPPVADHAALALRTLQPREATASLIELVDLPSPSQPAWDGRTSQYGVRELVRLSQLRNCLLCHAASLNAEDGLLRGSVPEPGARLTAPVGFVRADTTYFRQDFSVVLPVAQAYPWPAQQRFEFLTRLRPLKPNERPTNAVASGSYPQRQAVLYALRGLSGKNAGNDSNKWRELLGIAPNRKPPR